MKLISSHHKPHSLKAIQVDTLARKSTLATFSGENLHKNLPFLNSLAKQVVDSLQSMGTILDTEGELTKIFISYSRIIGLLCFLIDSIKCFINKIPIEFLSKFSCRNKKICICMQQCVNNWMFGFMNLSFFLLWISARHISLMNKFDEHNTRFIWRMPKILTCDQYSFPFKRV